MRLSLLTCAIATMLAGADTLITAPAPTVPRNPDHVVPVVPDEAASDQAIAAPAVWVGVIPTEVDDALSYHLGLSNDLGVIVEEVYPNSPAAVAGLKRFDVIVAIGDQPVYTPRTLQQTVLARKAGDQVTFAIRRGAQTVSISATVAVRPDNPALPPDFAAPRGKIPPPRLGDPLLGTVLPEDLPERMRRDIERVLRGDSGLRDGNSGRHGRIVTPHGTFEWSASEAEPHTGAPTFSATTPISSVPAVR